MQLASFRMYVNILTLSVESPMVYTKEGVALSVIGIAQVRGRGGVPL